MHNKVDAKSNGISVAVPCPSTANGIHGITLFVDCPGRGQSFDPIMTGVTPSFSFLNGNGIRLPCSLPPRPRLDRPGNAPEHLDQVKGPVHIDPLVVDQAAEYPVAAQVAQIRLRCSNPSVAAVKYNDPTCRMYRFSRSTALGVSEMFCLEQTNTNG